ncbi:MAG TPA: fused MFS/spermidine synthase [Methylomirabilota bacterium]|nr:fused MFS/spermidine synthase [Methylomirabilota bacterium]
MKKPTAPESPALSPALRRYFYFTAAVTGGAIMIVEILGAKMLSPYVGTSHFVWTAQIAVALIALSLGYYVGGWFVDRSPRVSVLYWAILLAALYLAITVAVVEPVAYWCLDLKPFALGSLLASLVLYFVPLALLAMAGPFFVRVLTSAVTNVGGNVGRLTAISTFGSFAGTVLIGYVLIPFLSNSMTMYVTSLILALVSMVYLLVWRTRKEAVAPIVLLVIGVILVGWAGTHRDRMRHSRAEEKFYGNSNFGMLQVFDMNDSRYYLNDYLVQNTYDPTQRLSTSMFTYMLHGLARAYTSNVQDVLCIGLGIGIVPMDFARDGARVDVVEINPAVVPVAQQWFDLEPDKLNIIIADGRSFLNECATKYDVVALDAFLGESSPSHLMTREAFAAMKRVLRPDGTLVINSFGNFKEGQDFSTTSLYKTLTNVFASVRVHTATGGNTFYVASEKLKLNFVNAPQTDRVHDRVRSQVQGAYAGVIEPGMEYRGLALHLQNGRVLTDDFNPVDFYDAANREQIRRSLAMSMKPPK